MKKFDLRKGSSMAKMGTDIHFAKDSRDDRAYFDLE